MPLGIFVLNAKYAANQYIAKIKAIAQGLSITFGISLNFVNIKGKTETTGAIKSIRARKFFLLFLDHFLIKSNFGSNMSM